MSIGYASINSIFLEIGGEITAKESSGIFITEVNYLSNVNADVSSSKILNAYQTNLNSHVVLSNTDSNSSITYQVTILNKKDVDYAFDKVIFLTGEENYDNEGITFKLNGLERGDVLESNESITFTITFYYKDNVISNNNILNSILNFEFEYVTSPVLASNMVPVIYEDNSWKKINEYSGGWHSYLNTKWANAITYNHNLVYNEVTNNVELKQFNGTSDYVYLGSAKYNFESSMTLVARFKIYEYGSDTQIAVGNIQDAGFYLGLNGSNKIRFRVNDMSSGTAVNVSLYSPKKIDLDTWYTVVAVYDGSMLKLYVDGELVDSVEYSNGISISTAPIIIGGNPNVDGEVTSSYFKGAISDIAVMKDVLTEEDIVQNYRKTMHHVSTNYKILYYLKFDASNGIVANSANYESDGMSFDGVNDYVFAGLSSYDFNNSFTIGARVKINEYSTDEYAFFGNPQYSGLNIFKSTGNKIRVAVYDNVTNDVTKDTYVVLETDYEMELDTWYTVVATYDGTTLNLFVNGKKEKSIDKNITMKVSNVPFAVGVNANLNHKTDGGYLNGKVSEVILIDEALSSAQVTTNYSNGLKNIISDKTLISYNLRGYEARENGTVIPDEMINGMWVWVPRFKVTTPTSSGEIDVTIVEPTEEAHDSFNFSNNDLEGFWVGKFENSSALSYTSTVTNVNLNSNILIKPNYGILRNRNIGSFFQKINSILTIDDIYGFVEENYDILDTHLVKNNEWGALSYLTQSKYGLCNGLTCKELVANSSDYISGSDNYILNVNQSTTQNIYGVYDVNGGTNEFAMGNYNNTLNSADGFSTLPNSIYFNTYTTSANYSSAKLQHAMIETNGLFNNSTSNFVVQNKPWVVRNGLFSYNNNTGVGSDTIGSRSALIIK